jgi:hypothetical protein
LGLQSDSKMPQDIINFGNWLTSYAHYVLSMESLETGYSSGIHGQILLYRGGLLNSDPSLPLFKPMLLHYTCEDRLVKFNIPGHNKTFR